MFKVLISLALFFSVSMVLSCDIRPAAPGSLRIYNNTSYGLESVTWNSVSFGNIAQGANSYRAVDGGSSQISFKFAGQGVTYSTKDYIKVDGADADYSLHDYTYVVSLNESSIEIQAIAEK